MRTILFPSNMLNFVDPHTLGILVLTTAVVYTALSFVTPVIVVIHRGQKSSFKAFFKAFIAGDVAAIVLSAIICYTLYRAVIIDPFTIMILVGIQIFTSVILALCEHHSTDITAD